ncbi:pilus assembly protein N-terminal domain-containing protein [Martelella sp. HB161492]|uniref:pilus assembly protein N-terminal domain-containing protein n=1 Tax=Martelella sp. HB161492 TaxID=2720726 RepID=UPI001590C789|nr:pilus assembly protein N-terminal domain-containing protein [Martelella sp. HB161492]
MTGRLAAAKRIPLPGKVLCFSILLLYLLLVHEARAAADSLLVEEGKGVLVGGTAQASALFVADPSVADLQGDQTSGYFVYGVSSGQTTLIGTDFAGNQIFKINVVVVQNLSEINRLIADRFPDSSVTLRASRGSVMLSGVVPDDRVHQALLESLKPIIPDALIVDDLAERGSGIIQIDVKIIDVRRSGGRSGNINGALGLAWGSMSDAASVVEGMLNSGAASVVSESTLTTTNKKKATFNAGEKVAVPTAITNTGSYPLYGVDYKNVGLTIDVAPDLLPADRIALTVDTEVSNQSGTSTNLGNGASVPNFNTRSFKTSVTLRSGQGFVLNTLKNAQYESSLSGEVRGGVSGFSNWISGALALIWGGASASSSTSDTEFIILLTPYFGKERLAQEMDPIGRPQSILENLLTTKRGGKGTAVRLYGNPGFIY